VPEYRWEYSPLAQSGNIVWKHAIDPALRLFADDSLTLLRRVRGVIQLTLVAALLLIPISFFYNTSHVLTAAGLLFDIAGVLRLFLMEEIEESLSGFKPDKHGNLPSFAMSELVMPEASGPYDESSSHISFFYYKKRGVLFLCLGFALQLAGC
jgi:hypothetical protein